MSGFPPRSENHATMTVPSRASRTNGSSSLVGLLTDSSAGCVGPGTLVFAISLHETMTGSRTQYVSDRTMNTRARIRASRARSVHDARAGAIAPAFRGGVRIVHALGSEPNTANFPLL